MYEKVWQPLNQATTLASEYSRQCVPHMHETLTHTHTHAVRADVQTTIKPLLLHSLISTPSFNLRKTTLLITGQNLPFVSQRPKPDQQLESQALRPHQKDTPSPSVPPLRGRRCDSGFVQCPLSVCRRGQWPLQFPAAGISLSGCLSRWTALQLLVLAARKRKGPRGAIYTLGGSLQHTGWSLCACLRATFENRSIKLQLGLNSSSYKHVVEASEGL